MNKDIGSSGGEKGRQFKRVLRCIRLTDLSNSSNLKKDGQKTETK